MRVAHLVALTLSVSALSILNTTFGYPAFRGPQAEPQTTGHERQRQEPGEQRTAERPMARVLSPAPSQVFARYHQGQGTQWLMQTAVHAFEATEGRATALLTFESDSPLKSNLPLNIERRLWQLDPTDGEGEFPFQATVVADFTQLSADRLYLDEIVLTGNTERPLRYGLLEVPLPPGADVERTTWGISVVGLGGDGAIKLEKARHETGELRYA